MSACDDLEELETSTHMFCSCARSAEVWSWIRRCCLGILPVGFAALSDFELIRLMFPGSLVAPTVVWLVGNYLDLAMPILMRRGPVLQLADVVAKLKNRYCAHQAGARYPLQPLNLSLG